MTHLELAREYSKRFDGFGKKTIARILHRDHPEMFKDVETARSKIRDVKGANGDLHRQKIKDKSDFDDRAKVLMGIFDDWEFGDLNDFSPYKIPKNIKKIGYMKDLHIPYHNKGAIMAALDYFIKKEIDCLILNGDIMDCYMLSRFQKDPTKRKFEKEREETRAFLERLRKLFPDILIVFKTGNHEERFEDILKVKAPEFFGMKEFKLDFLLRLRELNIEYVDKKRIIHAGKLNVLHGHEFGKQIFSPVNPARGVYMRAKENTAVGHHHQTSEHSEPLLNGKQVSCWSVACLCDMHPEYMPINKWNLGFAVQTIIDDDGNFRFDNKKILVDGSKNENFKFTIV